MRQVATRMNDEDVRALQKMADDEGRSLANFVKRVLQAYLEGAKDVQQEA